MELIVLLVSVGEIEGWRDMGVVVVVS